MNNGVLVGSSDYSVAPEVVSSDLSYETAYLEPAHPLRLRFDKALQLGEKRRFHPNAYRSWTVILDRELRSLFIGGKSMKELSRHFGRDAGAIRARLRKLGIVP